MYVVLLVESKSDYKNRLPVVYEGGNDRAFYENLEDTFNKIEDLTKTRQGAKYAVAKAEHFSEPVVPVFPRVSQKYIP